MKGFGKSGTLTASEIPTREEQARTQRAQAVRAGRAEAKALAEKAGFGDYPVEFMRRARGIECAGNDTERLCG